ncbi:MAG: leucine-rich repeat domain-containing protein, partial [Spirochaetaceae bacterium]|nr:leucine-rich repeat domain-containing protein [Spirochaetaceae bacterium]
MAVSAYAQYDDEKDFKVEREGNGITITRYIGTKTVVRIPPRIQNLPVTNIGSGAFAYCFSLASVTIPDSVTSIGEDAFFWCTSLTSVTIPNSVTNIGSGAFFWCTSLTSVTIPNSVTSIGDGAFSNCTSLIAINVNTGNSAYSAQDGILYNKDKTILHTYPAGKTNASFTIQNSVTSIGSMAFSGCISLTSVTIPNSVTTIGDRAFLGCENFTSVTIPNSVTSIGDGAFSNCTSLIAINVNTGNSAYSAQDGVLYNKNKTILHTY